jgi:hypothetical protein
LSFFQKDGEGEKAGKWGSVANCDMPIVKYLLLVYRKHFTILLIMQLMSLNLTFSFGLEIILGIMFGNMKRKITLDQWKTFLIE